MKARTISFCIFFLVLVAGTVFAEDSVFRPRLGCVPFLATSLQAMAFTEDISSSLLNSLDRVRYFEIVERKKIEQFLELEGYRLDNLDQAGILKISSKAGLDYVVSGSVTAGGAATTLTLELLDTRSKNVLMKESYYLSSSDFSRKLSEVAEKITERVRGGSGQPQLFSPAPVKHEKPAPPTGVEASGTNNSIRIRWQSSLKQSAGFNIYRSPSANGPYTIYSTAQEPSFTDENLKLNEEYYYRVAVVTGEGIVSEMSAPVRGNTVIAPPPPIFMNVEPEIKGATLAWRPRSGTGGDPRTESTGFRIYRKQGGEAGFNQVATLPAGTSGYTDRALSDGMAYTYMVTALNRDGAESDYSSRLGVRTLPVPAPPEPASGGIRQVRITWNRYPSERCDGYVIYRAASKDGAYETVARLEGIASSLYVDSGLSDRTTYWYRISAYRKDGGETDISPPVSATTRDIPPPPVKVRATGGQPRRITLSWDSAGTPEDEIKGFVIYRGMDEKLSEPLKIAEVPAGQNEYQDGKPPLSDGTTYYYRIVSINSGGAVSRGSSPVSATTKSPPEPPAGFRGSSGEVKKTVLSWEKNREPDIREYQVYVKRPDSSEFRLLDSVSGNGFTDSGLKDGAGYFYKIRAIDSDGLISDFSGEVGIRTKPLPAKVTGISVIDASLRIITWKPNQEKDVKKYNLFRKNFLGIGQKIAETAEPGWQAADTKGTLELYVTAVDDAGLESEPSETVVFKEQ